MKGNNMETLYTAEEVMVALKVKMPTIRSWIHQQRLPVVRAGRSVRIRESVLIKIIEEGFRCCHPEKGYYLSTTKTDCRLCPFQFPP